MQLLAESGCQERGCVFVTLEYQRELARRVWHFPAFAPECEPLLDQERAFTFGIEQLDDPGPLEEQFILFTRRAHQIEDGELLPREFDEEAERARLRPV